MRQKDHEVADAEAAKATAEKRARVAVWTAVGSALLISLLSITIAVGSATTRADDVAARISADVSASVVQDARQSRVLTGRAKLSEANGRLVARGLPIVPDPGPTASGDELLVQAARAAVLADLPDQIVADLRRQLAGREVFPSSLADRPLSGLVDGVVTTLPISPARPTLVELPTRAGSAPTGRGPAPTSAPSVPAAPAAPAPTSQSRGLLPLLPDLPIRVPLLSE